MEDILEYVEVRGSVQQEGDRKWFVHVPGGDYIYLESYVRENYYPKWLEGIPEELREVATYEQCISDWVVVNWAYPVQPDRPSN